MKFPVASAAALAEDAVDGGAGLGVDDCDGKYDSGSCCFETGCSTVAGIPTRSLAIAEGYSIWNMLRPSITLSITSNLHRIEL